jgi:hypothetical protein
MYIKLAQPLGEPCKFYAGAGGGEQHAAAAAAAGRTSKGENDTGPKVGPTPAFYNCISAAWNVWIVMGRARIV